jgi:hypothetical protein
MRLIGAIASGETPTSSEQADALDALNGIIEDWSNDGFMIFEKTIEEFTLTPGTGAYSIGDGATFDTTRPQLILGAKMKKAGESYEFPVEIYNSEQWLEITQRALQTGLPYYLYYKPSYPNGTINLWPVPDAANMLILSSLKPLETISAASTTLSYPPGYKKALKYALASELEIEFGRPINPKIEDVATKTKAAIQRVNTEPAYMQSDAFGLNECTYYDIWRPIG